jgi:phosphoesterase RecJ-like protein
MYEQFTNFLSNKNRICIIQAENPDGDSLGSAIALDYILKNTENSLYCPVDIPKYLHYFPDWSRVSNEFDYKADGYIIVDTAASVLLSKLLDDTAIRNSLYNKPVLVLDHHESEDDLDFPHAAIIEPLPACTELIYKIAQDQHLTIPLVAAEAIYAGISSDTLGLVSASVTADTMRAMAGLIDLGVNPAELEERRREFMKKSPRILDYKADLIKRIEYSLDNQLATVHIPFEDIQQYSDEYNPNVLILEEMRLVENVVVAIAIKTYPDGKVTGKIRTSLPIADQIAGFFGGGGHPFAAGFRTYDVQYNDVVADVVKIMPELIEQAAVTKAEMEQS